jgi:hypothetical protein
MVDGFVKLFVAVEVELGLALEAPQRPRLNVQDDAVLVGSETN